MYVCFCRCCKELNQWDLLLEYATSKGNTNPHLVLESAWRVPNWSVMKDALAQVTPGADSPNFIIVFINKILKKSEARHSVIFFTSYLGWNFDPSPYKKLQIFFLNWFWLSFASMKFCTPPTTTTKRHVTLIDGGLLKLMQTLQKLFWLRARNSRFKLKIINIKLI